MMSAFPHPVSAGDLQVNRLTNSGSHSANSVHDDPFMQAQLKGPEGVTGNRNMAVDDKGARQVDSHPSEGPSLSSLVHGIS